MTAIIGLDYHPQGRWWTRFADALLTAWKNYRVRRLECKPGDEFFENIEQLLEKHQ